MVKSGKYVVIIGLILLAAPATAQIEDLYVRGFISQGWLNSRDVNYLVDDSRDGTAEFHEAAVSILARPEEKLRVGIQFMARDFGDVGNNNVVIDWAYADYHWRDYLGLRVGKFKTLQGLYGQGRDVDMLRSTIMLPQSVYNEEHRDFIMGMEGAGFYGNLALDDGGNLDYEVYAGTLNVPDSEHGFWTEIWEQTGTLTVLNPQLGAEYTFLGVNDSEVKFDWMWGGGLQWHSPVDGIRLGATYMQANFDMSARLQFAEVVDGRTYHLDVPLVYSGDLDRMMTLSGEYVHGWLTLTLEYSQVRLNDATSEGWYAQLSWQAARKLALTGYYTEYFEDREQKDGSQFVDKGLRDFFGWQKDHCLAVRYDVSDHWLLKFEHHLVDGIALAGLAKNDPDDPLAMRRWWQYTAAKATFYF